MTNEEGCIVFLSQCTTAMNNTRSLEVKHGVLLGLEAAYKDCFGKGLYSLAEQINRTYMVLWKRHCQ